MSEAKALVRAAAELRAAGRPVLLATVVRVRGSAYRRPGARMLIGEDGWVAGSVSGGCLEGDVLRRGWWRTRDRPAAVVTYDATANDDLQWRLGLGCDGVVDVLVERLEPGGAADPLRFLEGCIESQRPGAMATVLRSDVPSVAVGARLLLDGAGAAEAVGVSPLHERLLEDAAGVIARGGDRPEPRERRYVTEGGPSADVLLEPVVPPPRLFVFGAGHDVIPLVILARAVGWEVFVCDTAARPSTYARFAQADGVLVGPLERIRGRVDASDRAVAVVMGHHYERDREALAALLASKARYIGVLGPRRRTERMLGELSVDSAAADARVHAPVGLELGAESPQEIALAIVAEVQSVLAGASGAALRDRAGPIHVDAEALAAREVSP